VRTILLLAGAGLGLLTACSAPAATPSTGATTTSSSVATSATSTPAVPDGSSARPFAFGHTWGGPGAMAITVGAPVAYTPSSAFTPGTFPRAVALDIEVANPADASPLPAVAITVQATAGKAQAEQIKDPTNGVGRPDASIEPGKTLKWKVAYMVPATPGDFTVRVGMVYGGQPVYFTGKI
jgi:hypothetical protein